MFTRGRERGVTLIELLVFIMIVSIAVVGILGVMTLTTSQSADALRRKQALMIAESLMEEVQSAQFTFCDPSSPDADTAANTADCDIPEGWGNEAPAERPFDNVNDYVTAPGAAQATFGSSPVLDLRGTAFTTGDYAATVAVQPAALGGLAAGGSADTPVLRITVTVSYGGESIVLDGYRARYAPL